MKLTLAKVMHGKHDKPKLDPDEKYTPDYIFDPLDREFGFTLDPCCTKASAKCVNYFTKKENGLKQSWAGHRVFMNPPYSQLEAWTAKAEREVVYNRALVVGLYPATRSEQPFWQTFIEPYRDRRWEHMGVPFTLVTRFVARRIEFGNPNNLEGGEGSGTFPSVLVIWTPR